MGIPVAKLREKWRKDPAIGRESEARAPVFDLARTLIEARLRAGLTQAEVAARMGTTQSAVARLEGGAAPSVRSVEKYAAALGCRVKVQLVSLGGGSRRVPRAAASKPANAVKPSRPRRARSARSAARV